MARRNKYNVAPKEDRTWNGRTYGSKAEMRYAKQLRMLLDAGDIVAVIEQPRVWLGVPENVYVPDFFVVRSDGDTYYVDVKGKPSPKFRRDCKLWAKYGPNWGRQRLVVVRTSGERFRVDETIEVAQEGEGQ